MLGINRDNLGRFAKSTFTRKIIKYTLFAGIIWFGYHMFTATYVIRNSDGIHGIIARKTWEQIQSDAQAAQIYYTTPPTYDYSSMQ